MKRLILALALMIASPAQANVGYVVEASWIYGLPKGFNNQAAALRWIAQLMAPGAMKPVAAPKAVALNVSPRDVYREWIIRVDDKRSIMVYYTNWALVE